MYRHDTVRHVRTHRGIHRNGPYERAIDGSDFELELSAGFDDLEAATEATGCGLDRSFGRYEATRAAASRWPARAFLEGCAKEPNTFGYDMDAFFTNVVLHAPLTGADRYDRSVYGFDSSHGKRAKWLTGAHVVRPRVAKT